MESFKKQYDKIVGAYLRNELNPMLNCACFIGNLLNNSDRWAYLRSNNCSFLGDPYHYDPLFKDLTSVFREEGKTLIQESGYSQNDIFKLEKTFLNTCYPGVQPTFYAACKVREDNLFKAMEVTLLELRKIHEEAGEVIEDYNFEKRVLETV